MRKKSKPKKHCSTQPPASGRKPSPKWVARDVRTRAEELAAFHRLFMNLFQRREQSRWSFFYLCGLLSNLERKTIEPMVLALFGADMNAIRGLQHFIGQGLWNTRAVVRRCQHLIAEWPILFSCVWSRSATNCPARGSGSSCDAASRLRMRSSITSATRR